MIWGGEVPSQAQEVSGYTGTYDEHQCDTIYIYMHVYICVYIYTCLCVSIIRTNNNTYIIPSVCVYIYTV